jgi:hypothetical protein
MKKTIYSLGLALMFLVPMIALGQATGYMPWPQVEDICMVPPGSNMNQLIFADTVTHTATWQNHTRVYVLQAGQTYNWTGACSLLVANRKIMIRGEYGKNYAQPAIMSSDIKPILLSPGASTTWFVLNAANDTICIKNIAIVGYDDWNKPTNIDAQNFSLISIGASGTGSIFMDSLTVSGAITMAQTNGRSNTVPGTVRIQNSIIGNVGGNFALTNLGAGRVIDLRGFGIDTLDMQNNTIFTVIDRVVRYLNSTKPVYSIKFNHNTVFNCLSYHGFMSLGWLDSLGAGPFQIKDNLFVDNYALGADTDWTRQGEMTDNPDLDVNNIGKCAWIIARKNTTTHNTPWDIKNNYYYISDSGKAIRDFETGVGLHHVIYPSSAPEPILTSDIAAQLNKNGGNASTAFKKTDINFALVSPFPSKLCRWYFSPAGLGYVPTTIGGLDSCVGAGAGKTKSTAKPIANWPKLTQFTTQYDAFNRWPYCYPRMRLDSLLYYFDCSFKSHTDLSAAASDGKIVGSTMWNFNGVITSVANSDQALPQKYAMTQNYPNPFNPSTNFTYELSKAGFVSVKVYDLLGREVATLVNEFKQAGSYPATWNAASFGSGVYFYKMQSGSFTSTKKMILMK